MIKLKSLAFLQTMLHTNYIDDMNYNNKSNLKLTVAGLAIAVLILMFFFATHIEHDAALAEPDSELARIEVSTAAGFYSFASLVNEGKISTANSYIMTNDIDLSESANDMGWQPVGYKANESAVAFEGIFDGAGFTIKGLWINAPDNISGAGLFGYNKGTIKNLNIELSEGKGGITAKYYAGAVAGINEGIIENCNVKGNITAEYSGGLTGLNSGTISRSVNYADITGSTGLGGITWSNTGYIQQCQNAGKITGTNAYSNTIGGIAGYHASKSITECANYGEINGYEWVGGIVGNATINSTITGCLNTGNITGTEYIGGIAGYSRAEISHCLNTSPTGGKIIGALLKPVTNCYYLSQGLEAEALSGEDLETGMPVSENELITRAFLEKLISIDANWTLRSPDDYHYYPELSVFLNNSISKQNALSAVAAYKGAPVLSAYTLTYGEELNRLSFAADTNGTFFWQEPDKVLNAGKNEIAYASFTPFANTYGHLYDIAITIMVNKAQSVLSVSISGWKKGTDANTPVITLTEGELEKSELIIEYKLKSDSDTSYAKNPPSKAGKYIVRVSYPESQNYLYGYAEYGFEIKADYKWLYILSAIFGGLIIIAFILFLTDKKYHYIKKLFIKETVCEIIVEKPVVIEKLVEIEKQIYIEPQINTSALSEYQEKLTNREIQVAKKILEGKTRKEISEELQISEKTVRTHIENILRKTDCQNQRIFALRFKS